MKSVPISELRKRVADVIEDVQRHDEAMIVLQRSRPAAYIVSPERFERDQRELLLLRRQLFLAEIHEAEAEYRAGESPRFADVDELLNELRG
jgi:prevent-host-death family protein